jgi:hypothetical protein
MTPDEYADEFTRMRAKLNHIRARIAEYDAREPERIRQQLKTELALERLHRANVALRAALPR